MNTFTITSDSQTVTITTGATLREVTRRIADSMGSELAYTSTITLNWTEPHEASVVNVDGSTVHITLN